MDFCKILFFVFACMMAVSFVSVDARWKPFKKLEKSVRRVRDGIIKAGPAVAVVGQAQSIYKGKK